MADAPRKLTPAEQALLAKVLQGARSKKSAAQTIQQRPPGEPSVLSFAQQRMWFLSQWEPDSAAYNISFALRIFGLLDVDAFQRAFREIILRHAVLQMVYTTVNGEPSLVPHPDPVLPLEVENLEGLPSEDRMGEAARRIQEGAAAPFNLERDLPLRSRLFRLSETEYVWLFVVHHIASDGWSLGLLFKELSALFGAFHAGQPSPLPELPVQYADFAAWQREYLKGEALEKRLAYWKKQLSGAPSILEVPADRPRPAVRSNRGAIFDCRFPAGLSQSVKDLSRKEGVTPFMILLAAFQILLFRYTGQSDFVIGSPIAGRNLSEIEGLIGFFVNTLLIRADLSGDPTVNELLQRVRERTLDAYEHQDLPFEKLVEELHPQRDLSHPPLFQVMFNYQSGAIAVPVLPGLAVEALPVDNGTSKFDLNFHFIETNGSLEVTITYDIDLFERETILRMVGHYQTLLDGMARNSHQRVSRLTLLTRAEKRQFETWAETRTEYPGMIPLHRMFEQQADRLPDQPAVYVDDYACSYRELNEHANQIAHFLIGHGVGPDMRVGLFMERSLDIMAALLGILKAGAAYVPIDPIYPPDRVRFMLEDVQVSVVLTQSDLVSKLPVLSGIRVVCLDSDWEEITACSKVNPDVTVALNHLMYVLFTSGSTGRPKGVAVEHRNYLNYFNGIVRRMPIEAGMHFAMVSTFATDLGTITFWGAFYVGGTVFIASYERATDPEALAAWYRRHRIDVLKLVPSHLDALMSGSDPAGIVPGKLLIITGEASYWDTVAKVLAINPKCMIQDHYGVTETTCATLVYQSPQEVPVQHGPALPKGFPLGNVRIHILDAQMRPTPVGIPGELFIGGAGVTRGYINRPSLTAERFIPDPFSYEPGARLYRTGDLACYLPDGTMKLLGRMDFQVKIRGYRIELGEIETLLIQHPSVGDAVVFARRDGGEDRLVAYVTQKQGSPDGLEIDSLREDLRERLPEYMVPVAFVPLEKIPLNPNGKVDRFALPAPELSQASAGHMYVPPGNLHEQHMAEIWAEVLKIDNPGMEDNFFDLGGDSFKAIRVARKIGEGVSVMDLFKRPTIRQLCEYLSQGQQQGSRPSGMLHELTRPSPAGKKLLNLVCVPYGGGSPILFQPLASSLPPGISLYAVDLPGHDTSRPNEALLPIRETARRCAEEIRQRLDGPVVFYGHCVGGAVALEIARCLEENDRQVTGVILGAHFPNARLPGKLFELLHRLLPTDRWASSRMIYEGLRALGGFSDEMDKAEREFVVCSLRHDVFEAEDYYTEAYGDRQWKKLKAPILAIAGERDRSTEYHREEVHEWDYFSDRVDLAVIPAAGHYFLKHQSTPLAAIIQRQANAWMSWDGRKAGEEAPVRRDDLRKQGFLIHPASGLLTFFVVVIGQLISQVGSGLTSFALGVWVYQQTGSVTQLSSILVAAFLPGILILPISGALADRHDRRLLMIISDGMAACGVFFLAILLWTGRLQIWQIYITASIGSIANALQRPAYTAAITQLVPKRYLGQANGLTQFGLAASDLLSPMLGGLLITTIGLHSIILLDFISFLFAILTLALVKFPDRQFHKQEEPFRKAITGGFFYIIKRQGLLAMVIFFVLFNFLIAIVNVIQIPLVLSFAPPSTLGLVSSASGLGIILGSLAMSIWGGTKRRAEGMIAFVVPFGLAVLFAGLRPSPVFPAIGLFGFGLALTLTNAHWQALIQLKVGLELQGRVVSMNQMLGWSMIPLGFITTGPLVERVFEPLMADQGPLAGSLGLILGIGPGRGMGLLMVVIGMLYLLLAIAGFKYRPLRFMEDSLPDAVPGAVITFDKDELQALADRSLAPLAEQFGKEQENIPA